MRSSFTWLMNAIQVVLNYTLFLHWAIATFLVNSSSARLHGTARHHARRISQSGVALSLDRRTRRTPDAKRALSFIGRYLWRFIAVEVPELLRSTQSTFRLVAEALSLAALAQFVQQADMDNGIILAVWDLLVRFWLVLFCSILHDVDGACRIDTAVGQFFAGITVIALIFTIYSNARMSKFLSKSRRLDQPSFLDREITRISKDSYFTWLFCSLVGSLYVATRLLPYGENISSTNWLEDPLAFLSEHMFFAIFIFWIAGFPFLLSAASWSVFDFTTLRRPFYRSLLRLSYTAPPVFLIANFAVPYLYIVAIGYIGHFTLAPASNLTSFLVPGSGESLRFAIQLLLLFMLVFPPALHYAFLLASMAGNSFIVARVLLLFALVVLIDLAIENWQYCDLGADGVATCVES